MATLYRPNHRFRGPQESDKHRTSQKIIYDGLNSVKEQLNLAQAIGDGGWNDRLLGNSKTIQSKVKITEWTSAKGAFLEPLAAGAGSSKRFEVYAESDPDSFAQRAESCDILAFGVGDIPIGSFDPDLIASLIGRTPVILGRSLLPYLEPVWPVLGIFETEYEGTPGDLQSFGLDSIIDSSSTASANSIIPPDGLAAKTAPILSGRGAHRFYAALGPKTLILSYGEGILPNQTTSEERAWTLKIIQAFAAPLPTPSPMWSLSL